MKFLEEEYLLALSAFEFLTVNKVGTMLKHFLLPSKICEAIESENGALNKFLAEKEIETLRKKFLTENFIESYNKNLKKEKICFISVFNKSLSEKLKQVFETASMLWLYYMGNLNLLEEKAVAIVGTRMPDSYGKKLTQDFTSVLTKAGFVVVSGLAAGVDSVAHTVCMQNGGRTVAVLGGGFSKIYPSFNTNLAAQIAQNGLLLSEYAPHIKPNSFHFPARNRIVAAISDCVFIPQMGEKSGALHTKNFAIDYNKTIYIACADCYRDASAGNLRLIDSNPGCAVATPARILFDFGMLKTQCEKEPIQLGVEEQAVVNCLKKGEKHFDEIAQSTNFPAQNLLCLLTTLKINGIITQLPNNYYMLSKEL